MMADKDGPGVRCYLRNQDDAQRSFLTDPARQGAYKRSVWRRVAVDDVYSLDCTVLYVLYMYVPLYSIRFV